jgi:predicted NAD/FAD-binding protein
MLRDLLRFNRLCTRIAQAGRAGADAAAGRSEAHRFGDAFRDWYLLPMLGCIWSCPTDQMLRSRWPP